MARVYARCANCEIEIRWRPVSQGEQRYCCHGCAHGGPCTCDYSDLPRLRSEDTIWILAEIEQTKK